MESMRQTSSDMLRAEQSNYQIRGGAAPRRVHRGGYRNKGLDGIRFLRTFEGDRVPTGTPPVDRSGTRGGKFHTAVPFEYGKRGRFQPRGGPAGANLTRGGAGGAGSFRGPSIPRGHAMPGGSMSSKRQEYEQLIADVNQHRNQSRFESSRESAERESSPPRRQNVENDAFTRDIQREERRQNERGVHRSTTYPDSTRGRSDQHGDSPATSDRLGF